MTTRRAFILGAHCTRFIGKRHPDFIDKSHKDFGKRKNPTLEELITSAVQGALKSSGVPAKYIQNAFIGNAGGEMMNNQGHLGPVIAAADPDLCQIAAHRVEAHCCSGSIAVANSVRAIRAGQDFAIGMGAEVENQVSARIVGQILATGTHYATQHGIDDFTFPALIAMRAKAALSETSLTLDDLALVAVRAYERAKLNPNAHLQFAEKLTVESARDSPKFLNNPDLKPYIRMSDCSQVSDGAAAVVVVSEEGLRKMGKSISDAVEVLNMTVCTDNLLVPSSDPFTLVASKTAADRAYAAAKIRPEEIKYAELHDGFTLVSVLLNEAAGFSKKGEGFLDFKNGKFDVNGPLPINMGGGILGSGHPVGATGVRQIVEIFRQMKGLCGEYQVPNIPELGFSVNFGGDDKSACAGIYRNH